MWPGSELSLRLCSYREAMETPATPGLVRHQPRFLWRPRSRSRLVSMNWSPQSSSAHILGRFTHWRRWSSCQLSPAHQDHWHPRIVDRLRAVRLARGASLALAVWLWGKCAFATWAPHLETHAMAVLSRSAGALPHLFTLKSFMIHQQSGKQEIALYYLIFKFYSLRWVNQSNQLKPRRRPSHKIFLQVVTRSVVSPTKAMETSGKARFRPPKMVYSMEKMKEKEYYDS